MLEPWIGYLVSEVVVLLWILGWAISTHLNRNDAIIAKRGFSNMMILSLVIFLCWSENLLLVGAFLNLYLSIPCSPHLYINYLFFGLFMFTFIVRGICLVFEKHSGTIKTLDKDELDDYLSRLGWLEKMVLRSKSLKRKLKFVESNRESIIEDHFNQTKFFKPRFVLKCRCGFMLVGAIFGSIELAGNPEKATGANCTFEMYLPLYAFFAINMFLSFYVAYLLRHSFDPYFMKWEFTIFMCVVLPICYVVGLSLRFSGYSDWVIFIVLMILIAHAVSIVIPNILVWKNKKTKFTRLRSPSQSSIKMDLTDLKKKAADRFCLELVLYKEDFDIMQLLKSQQDVDIACLKIWDKYFARDAPHELNLPFKLQHDVRMAFTQKTYVPILEVVYAEVKTMIYQNLELK